MLPMATCHTMKASNLEVLHGMHKIRVEFDFFVVLKFKKIRCIIVWSPKFGVNLKSEF